MAKDTDAMRARELPGWVWPLVPVLAALAVMRAGLGGHDLFDMRDMTGMYWPYHQWFRATVSSGGSLLWDPYAGFGHSAIADPTRQLLFPPVVLLRLFLPEVVGFNASVICPFPVAAVGTYLFLRRHGSRPAASLGATIFAAGGPVVTSGVYLNLSWTVALIPWLLWAADRLSEARSAVRFGSAALVASLLFLAGEPVAAAGAVALAIAYAVFAATGTDATRARLVNGVRVGAALAVGAGLAAPLLLPLGVAAFGSTRAAGFDAEYLRIGSLHPLQLLETIAPALFGDPIGSHYGFPPWLLVLVRGFEPILYGFYLGVAALTVAALGLTADGRRRWTIFWCAVAVLGVALAFGPNTPVYPALARLPLVRSFRFPVKFSIHASFAVAVLAATGWDVLAAPRVGRVRRAVVPAALVALAALGGLLALSVVPGATSDAIGRFAEVLGVRDVAAGTTWMARSLSHALPRVAALAGATAFFVWLATVPGRERFARVCLFSMIAIDLAVTNGMLNPAADAELFGAPAWVRITHEHPEDRTYVGPRIPFVARVTSDPDAPHWSDGPPITELPDQARRGRYVTELSNVPGRDGLRDSFSPDIAALWSREYRVARDAFMLSDRTTRLRFLGRVATRYVVLPEPPEGAGPPRAELVDVPGQALYEVAPTLRRAFVVTTVELVADRDEQIRRMFAVDFDPGSAVQLEAPPPDAGGVARDGVEPAASITDDGSASVAIRAGVPDGGGFLVLSDSYDPDWVAEVDGQTAPVLRANGMFRAVRLAPGEHDVTFVYRPRAFLAGCAVAVLAALGLVLAYALDRRARHRA